MKTEYPLHTEAKHRRLGEGRSSCISVGEASRARYQYQLLACRREKPTVRRAPDAQVGVSLLAAT